MKLLVLLVVLAVRRMDFSFPAWLADPERFLRFDKRMATVAGKQGVLHWLLVVLVPSVLVGMLVCWLESLFWGIPGWLAGGLVLLWLLGVESDFRHVDELILHGRMGQQKEFERTAFAIFEMPENMSQPESNTDSGNTSSVVEYFSSLVKRIAHHDFRFLFATVFCLIAGGYWLATFYVLNRLWLESRQQEEISSSIPEYAGILDDVIYWIPARLLLLSMALSGDFNRVKQAIGDWTRLETPDELLESGLYASLDEVTGEAGNLEQGALLLESVQSVLTRCMAIWLIFAAVWMMIL